MSPLKIGRDLVRLRDVNVRLETWRIVIRETIFFFFFPQKGLAIKCTISAVR